MHQISNETTSEYANIFPVHQAIHSHIRNSTIERTIDSQKRTHAPYLAVWAKLRCNLVSHCDLYSISIFFLCRSRRKSIFVSLSYPNKSARLTAFASTLSAKVNSHCFAFPSSSSISALCPLRLCRSVGVCFPLLSASVSFDQPFLPSPLVPCRLVRTIDFLSLEICWIGVHHGWNLFLRDESGEERLFIAARCSTSLRSFVRWMNIHLLFISLSLSFSVRWNGIEVRENEVISVTDASTLFRSRRKVKKRKTKVEKIKTFRFFILSCRIPSPSSSPSTRRRRVRTKRNAEKEEIRVEASIVVPHLYLGSIGDACTPSVLSDLGITHPLNLTHQRVILSDDFQILHLPLNDSLSEELIEHFSRTNLFLRQCQENNGRCLVFCKYGRSRSVTSETTSTDGREEEQIFLRFVLQLFSAIWSASVEWVIVRRWTIYVRVARRCIRTGIIFVNCKTIRFNRREILLDRFFLFPKKRKKIFFKENKNFSQRRPFPSSLQIWFAKQKKTMTVEEARRRDALDPFDFENEMIVTEPGDTIGGFWGFFLVVESDESEAFGSVRHFLFG